MDRDLLLARWRATGLATTTRGAAAGTAAAEVARLGAVQAQEFEMTLWSLGRRTGSSRAEVLAAYDRGEIVRTHALRPTWHFVHHDDLPWVQAASAPRVQRVMAGFRRQLGLDDELLSRCLDLVVVAAGRPVTRRELGEVLAAAGFDVAGERLGMIMMSAELEDLVTSGPMAGSRHTYVARDRPAPPPRPEAVARLVATFLAAHKPATIDDVAEWATLTKTEVRRAVADLAPAVQRLDALDRTWWWLGDLDDSVWDSPQVELLNGYDEYISGFSAAGKRLLDRAGLAGRRRHVPVGVVMVDGQLAGHWRRRVTAPDVSIDVFPLRGFDRAEQHGLESAAARYADFVERRPVLTVHP